MMKGYIMEKVLETFAEMSDKIEKDSRDDIGTASGGVKKLAKKGLKWLTITALAVEDVFIEADLSMAEDPTIAAKGGYRKVHDLEKVRAYEKDVELASEALNKAIDEQNEDDITLSEAALYRAKLGLNTYNLKYKKSMAR